jgi:Arc/MetJ family transcription regulator
MGARGVTHVPGAVRLRARRTTCRGRRRAVARTGDRADRSPRLVQVILQGVGDGRPYPDHGCGPSDWAALPPRQVRLDTLVTTKRMLDLEQLLDEQSTFYGDLFAHVVQWNGVLYLEDGLHRALRTALHGRPVLHARILDLDDPAWVRRLADRDTSGAAR